jgi:hypothetical protein
LRSALTVGAGDDVRADGRLDGHVELLARDQILHAFHQLAATPIRMQTVHDRTRAHRRDRR